MLALILLADGRLQIELGVARVELPVQISLIEHLQLSRHLVRSDVHFRTASNHLLRVRFLDLFLQLGMLHLNPVER